MPESSPGTQDNADPCTRPGDLSAFEYSELKRMASAKLRHERSGEKFQTTALVHEAFVRLADGKSTPEWESDAHFFSAAAEAMRRILVDRARQRKSLKRGGQWQRLTGSDAAKSLAATELEDRVVAVHEALGDLAVDSPRRAELVKLRFFVGMTIEEAAQALCISVPTAKRDWAAAKVWIFRRLKEST
ncbi:ECF-type sigma factor [Stieleria sp. ICT_E10.1]|uniref:ECF-type sigma factor n=1 Tax=Stieleria sedimenti TaxID=2976331 RepID=UPI00217FD114|nr:ECF-type sigma factor [Stieleria sedimenti]MCS7468220.1 ECF-type sigma factor [Stieleria sedimenti]